VSIELFNIEEAYAVFSKSNYATKRHSHYALEIVYCTEGSFSIVTDHANYTNLQNVVIPPNLRHAFSCMNATCNLLFLDPLSETGRYFMQQYHLASVKDILVNLSELEQFHTNGKFDIPLIAERAKTSMVEELDSRILNCIEAINSLFANQKVTLSQLSDVSFLSEGRLSHLFKKQLGISVHQYILWKKITLAVLKSREGFSLTECAHYVGFADSSHFNKVFFKMFGIKPFFVLKS
jgi:AraC-like DNA-binding protein